MYVERGAIGLLAHLEEAHVVGLAARLGREPDGVYYPQLIFIHIYQLFRIL